jgi:hypothetical protein
LNKAALNAEWNVPDGRLGAVIQQLRRRAMIANSRARWQFWLLMGIVLISILAYLLPVLSSSILGTLLDYRQFEQVRTESQIADTERELRDLSGEVVSIVDDIVAQVGTVADALDQPANALLTDYVTFGGPDGATILYGNGSRAERWRASADNVQEVTAFAGLARVTEMKATPDGSVLLASDGREVIQSLDGGQSWQPTTPRIAVTDGLEIVDIVVSLDKAYAVIPPLGVFSLDLTVELADWQLELKLEDQFPTGATVLRDGRIALFSGSTILAQTTANSAFRTKNTALDVPNASAVAEIIALLEVSDGLLAVFSDGTVLLAANVFEQWRVADDIGQPDPFARGVVAVPGGHVIYGFRTNFMFSPDQFSYVTLLRDGGTETPQWRLRVHDSGGDINGALTLQDGRVLLYGDGGAMVLIEPGSDELPRRVTLDSGTRLDLRAAAEITDGRVLIAGDTGYLALSQDLLSWRQISAPEPMDFRRIALTTDLELAFILGRQGAVVVTDTFSDQLFALRAGLQAPLTGDDVSRVLSNLDDLPLHVLRNAPIPASLQRLRTLRTEITQTNEQRQALLQSADASETRSVEWESYGEFLKICRAGANGGDATTTCNTAWQELQDAAIWDSLRQQIPPAILILFLLATLGGLHRYNQRLAGFHHARADLLELVSVGRDEAQNFTKEDWEAISRFSDVLAADKVEFGKGNTPSDQAVDIAKTIASRS